MKVNLAIGKFAVEQLANYHPNNIIKIIYRNDTALMRNNLTNFKQEINANFFEKEIKKGDIDICAFFNSYIQKLSDKDHILIENLRDAGEAGTIIRTAICFDYFDIVFINCDFRDFDSKLIRSSVGAYFIANVKTYGSFAQYKVDYPNSKYIKFKSKDEPLSLEVGEKLYSLKKS